MNKSEKFREVFGIYAEEFWAMSEKEMLEWIAEDINVPSEGYWQPSYDGLHCSVCNFKSENTGLPNVCPHCGTSMKCGEL